MDIYRKSLPDYINFLCVEGVLGAGKTSLCQLIAQEFNARMILEKSDENPFLTSFYKNREKIAFQTQMWFLLFRYTQMKQEYLQQDVFHHMSVADYVFSQSIK